jgi:hypothetical protein
MERRDWGLLLGLLGIGVAAAGAAAVTWEWEDEQKDEGKPLPLEGRYGPVLGDNDPFHPDIQRLARGEIGAILRDCRTPECPTTFPIKPGEARWYLRRNLRLPMRCPDCRDRRRVEAERRY